MNRAYWDHYWSQGKETSLSNELHSLVEDFVFNHINSGKVLEIGSGRGYLNSLMREKGIDAIGIDSTNTKQVNGTKSIRAAAEALPMKNESFDSVVSVLTLSYTDKDKAMKEIKRVLKSNGKAVLVLHDKNSGVNKELKRMHEEKKRQLETVKLLDNHVSEGKPLPPTWLKAKDKKFVEWAKKFKDDWDAYNPDKPKVRGVKKLKKDLMPWYRKNTNMFFTSRISGLEKIVREYGQRRESMENAFQSKKHVIEFLGKHGFEVIELKRMPRVGFAVVAKKKNTVSRIGKP